LRTGRKCTGQDNSTGQKFPLHRPIAIDPLPNMLEYRARNIGTTFACAIAQSASRRTEHQMSISSVTGFSPVTSTFSPQNISSAGSASASAATSQGDSVVQDFLNYAKMSPMERMREEILKGLGLTDQQFKELSPAQQQAVDQKIQQIMLQQLQQKAGATGQVVDVSA
jgi:hypothetical protein